MFKAILLQQTDDKKTRAELVDQDDSALPDPARHEVTVDVAWSTLNFKDALTLHPVPHECALNCALRSFRAPHRSTCGRRYGRVGRESCLWRSSGHIHRDRAGLVRSRGGSVPGGSGPGRVRRRRRG